MPNVENIQYEKAIEKLSSAGFSKANITAEYEFNDKVLTGYVYAQTPAESKGYPADQKITLYVSRGPEPTTAPPTTTTEPTTAPQTTAPPVTQPPTTAPVPTTTTEKAGD